MYKYLFDINYNNKVFSIFLGENNHKAFLESKNGKYYYPLYEDYLYLNNKFNKEALSKTLSASFWSRRVIRK